MIRIPPIALAALAAATLGLTACGGSDGDSRADAVAKASKALQDKGITKDQADQLAETAQKVKDSGISDAAAAEVKREISDGQRRATDLQKQLVAVTKAVQAKTITEAAGTKKINDLRRRIQEQALSTASALEKIGALPEGAKEQVDKARQQLKDGTATTPTAPAIPSIPSQ